MHEGRSSWLAFAVSAALACSGDTTHLRAESSEQGQANFRLGLTTGSEVDSVDVVLTSPDASVETFTVDTKGGEGVTISLGGLAPGLYSVTLRAATTEGAACNGSTDFQIVPDTTTAVPLLVVCTLPPKAEGRAEIEAEFVVQESNAAAEESAQPADAGLPLPPR